MGVPSQFRIFSDTGEIKREKENFQNFLFKGINFRKSETPISFQRSDFRSVKMQNMYFYKNNFDRADIVNAYIEESYFEECFFGTDFINTVFKNCSFKQNSFDTSSINNCRYFDCHFEGDVIINSTNRESVYANCSFQNCSFEMNTFDNIQFDDCGLTEINFAEMGAYNFSFSGCSLKDVKIDPDYIGSYLIKDTPLDGVSFMYRGDELQLNDNLVEDLRTLSVFYFQSNRFYEAFNLVLLFRQYSQLKTDILAYFEKTITQIIDDEHYLRKIEQMNGIIKTVIFYANSKVLTIEESFSIIQKIENSKIHLSNISDNLKFINNVNFLKQSIESKIFDFGDISSVDTNKKVYCEITIDENNYFELEIRLKDYFDSLSKSYGIPHLSEYQIIGSRKGSLIVEIIGYTVGIYVLVSILKSIFVKALEIKIEYTIFQKANKFLKQENTTLKEFEGETTIARRILSKPSNEIIEKAKPLSQLMKHFSVFPNTFTKVREK